MSRHVVDIQALPVCTLVYYGWLCDEYRHVSSSIVLFSLIIYFGAKYVTESTLGMLGQTYSELLICIVLC